MNDNLQRYLSDHLAGAAGAVDLIQVLAERCDEESKQKVLFDLRSKVEADRLILKNLIERAGFEVSRIKQVAGNLTEKASRLKLKWEGLEPGQLGTFEALEMVVLGIQGKRVLWLMLAEIAAWVPGWAGVNFKALELEAISQRDAVEELRIEAGAECLLDPGVRVPLSH